MAYGALIRSGDGSTVCGALTWRGWFHHLWGSDLTPAVWPPV